MPWCSASLATMVMLALAMTGCSATGAKRASRGPEGQAVTLSGDESVTALLNYFGLEGRAIEGELVGCIRDGIRRARPELRVVLPDEFRRLAFPDLAPEAAPRSAQYLGMLLDNASFRERIAPLNLHYLIAIGGETRVKQWGGAIAGSAPAPAGAFLFGAWVWDRDTRLVASILDLKQSGSAVEISATAQGRAWLVLVEGLPLGAPAFTEANACARLGDKLSQFLVEPRRAQ